MPDDIQPVQDFKLNKYLGMWYEIAHFDHSFEKDLTNVTANYSLRDDEGVNVINKGYDPEKGEWDTAEDVAYFVKESSKGHLKVSFFGPFYSSYVIFKLDNKYYQYSYMRAGE